MTESQILFPWDACLHEEARDTTHEAVATLVQRSGLRRGYFHVEFLVRDRQAFVIDANIGRIGGGGLGQQIALAYEMAPEDVHAHALSLSIDDPAPTPVAYSKGPRRRTISVMYGVAEDSEFLRINLPRQPPGYHTLLLDAPQRVPAMGTDNYSWIAIASGEDGPLQSWLHEVSVDTSRGRVAIVY
jgi:hypothetical protein